MNIQDNWRTQYWFHNIFKIKFQTKLRMKSIQYIYTYKKKVKYILGVESSKPPISPKIKYERTPKFLIFRTRLTPVMMADNLYQIWNVLWLEIQKLLYAWQKYWTYVLRSYPAPLEISKKTPKAWRGAIKRKASPFWY